jgi:hypothetical protein
MKHLDDAVTTQRMLGLFADHLRNNPCNRPNSCHVSTILLYAGLYVSDYASAITKGLEPFDAMSLALERATDQTAEFSFNDLVVRE